MNADKKLEGAKVPTMGRQEVSFSFDPGGLGWHIACDEIELIWWNKKPSSSVRRDVFLPFFFPLISAAAPQF